MGRRNCFSGLPSLTLTGWEKIRNLHSPDFRSGQKGLDVTNYGAIIAFHLNRLNARGSNPCFTAKHLMFSSKHKIHENSMKGATHIQMQGQMNATNL